MNKSKSTLVSEICKRRMANVLGWNAILVQITVHGGEKEGRVGELGDDGMTDGDSGAYAMRWRDAR
ncbi:hypothetical protein N7535_001043 [Penicillium sp. DV-2018c]|nr:hypothetical protein N7461_005716 [Penicillium sp. DV-2018c]KAJ5582423.1 hypothetical protein N7535_001043 [Penicillium sp. DV-2018c]